MLSHEQIEEAIRKASSNFPLAKVSYFGSYADGRATGVSDLDLLVEFKEEIVSLFTLIDVKHFLEDELNILVDVIQVPLAPDSIIKIENEVLVYDYKR